MINFEAKSGFLVFLTLGVLLAFRFYFFFNDPKQFKDGDKIRLSFSVSSEPTRYDTKQYLKKEGLKIYLPLYPEIYYGDNVTLEGIVEKGELKNPKLVALAKSESNLNLLRRKLIDVYKVSLPTPHSSLVAGVAIGTRQNIPSEFWESLKNTGTAHVVVASGMNISLVGGFLVNFFAIFLKRGRALLLAISGVWIYAVLCGFEAPIVRAAIMGTLVFTAQEIGRLSISLRTLFLSAFLMLFINPAYVEDLGFWLSFVATFSIIFFEEKIRRRLTFVPAVIKQDLSTTLSAQIGVTPILFYFFGQFNLFSVVVNMFVLWTIVPITLIGMVGGLVGLIFQPIGTILLWFSYPLTLWFVTIVKMFG